MREVISRYVEYEQTPSGLEALIHDLRREQGATDAAATLGISRSTVSYWLRKLASFRLFAGQDPEQILQILWETSETEDLDYASRLVGVDPKTLDRAFGRMTPVMQKAA